MKRLGFKAYFLKLFIFFLSSNTLIAQENQSKWNNFKSNSELYGFTDFRSSFFTSENNQVKDYLLSEYKVQIDAAHFWGLSEFKLKNDFIYDIHLNKIRLDLREANVWVPLGNHWEIKLGRQILTWGKGDLVFINDLFPKDWQSFFNGRELSYLKAPSDALKLNFANRFIQINFIYTPQFDPDRFLTGERLSFSAFQSSFNFENRILTDLPNSWINNAEYALRLQKNIGVFDIALYGYHGYWKSPSGFSMESANFIFPSLTVYGGSIEFNALKGVFANEWGHYISHNDSSGLDPLIRNDEFRWLVSYSRDLKKDWSIGLQYYSELTLNYDELKLTWPFQFVPNKFLDQFSLRLGKNMFKQKLRISLIGFYSFSGNDSYIRPRLLYNYSDNITFDIGGNIFLSENSNTFWGQFDTNDNFYFGLKYNF